VPTVRRLAELGWIIDPEVERIVKQRRGLIADEMGLGKTVTSLAVARAADVKRLVVVCPAGPEVQTGGDGLRAAS